MADYPLSSDATSDFEATSTEPRTLLVTGNEFLDHQTGSHPENPQRLEAILGQFRGSGIANRCRRLAPIPAPRIDLERVHTSDYLNQLSDWASNGGGQVEEDTVMSARSWDVARLAAGSVIRAVDEVLSGRVVNAFCAVRPPGHHALPDAPMGFCLINSVATAAAHALAQGLNRVLIVDFDVHHGNGTQAAFYEVEEIAFFSVHRFPFYPGTGSAVETGTGRGLGSTRNLPIRFGTPPEQTLVAFESELFDFASRMNPDLILVSAGFDAHRLDPVGNLGWELESFEQCSRTLTQLARQFTKSQLVSVLEGGYHPRYLASAAELHLQELIVASEVSRSESPVKTDGLGQ